jgi:hypothetical protein
MNVICIKPTKRLVKNATYKVASFQNQNTKGYSFFRATIRIYLTDDSVQNFPLDSFKPTVGDTFQKINYISPEYRLFLDERDQMKIDKHLKGGDYVVPTHDGLKTLVKGRKYKVKDVRVIENKSSYGVVTWTDIKIKLEGSERWYTSWNFRKCTNQEAREISLKSLFDEAVDVEKVNKHKRKFDYHSDEEKVSMLLRFIISSANDRYRNQMDIINWTIEKTADKYSLKKEDFDLVRTLTLEQILEIIK